LRKSSETLRKERLSRQVRISGGSSIELIVGKYKKAYGRTICCTLEIRLNVLKKNHRAVFAEKELKYIWGDQALKSLLDKTGADAACADLHAFHGLRFFVHAAQLLQIGKPYFSGFVIGMTDTVAHDGLLPTYFTDSGHLKTPSNRLRELLNHKN
jgi:hypothetical protein